MRLRAPFHRLQDSRYNGMFDRSHVLEIKMESDGDQEVLNS